MKLNVFQIKLSEFIHGLRSYKIDELRVEERMKNCELWYGLGIGIMGSPEFSKLRFPSFNCSSIHIYIHIVCWFACLNPKSFKTAEQIIINNVCGSSYDPTKFQKFLSKDFDFLTKEDLCGNSQKNPQNLFRLQFLD